MSIRVLFFIKIIKKLGKGLGLSSTLRLELLKKVLNLLHFILKFHQIQVFTCGSSYFTWAPAWIKSLFQYFLILPLLILDFNLFLSKFFSKPHNSLRFIFASSCFLSSDLDAQLIDVSFKLSLLAVLRLKFFLNFSNFSIKLLLLVIQLIDFLS